MDCPVCKYPNAAGATHCGMCYEVFNRSAAQAYLHAVKRERRLTEDPPSEPATGVKSWSERHGRLDTPMEHYKIDEIGNVTLQKIKSALKKTPNTVVVVRAK